MRILLSTLLPDAPKPVRAFSIRDGAVEELGIVSAEAERKAKLNTEDTEKSLEREKLRIGTKTRNFGC